MLNERYGCELERALSQGRERGALERVGRSPKCDRGGERRVVRNGVQIVGRDGRWLR